MGLGKKLLRQQQKKKKSQRGEGRTPITYKGWEKFLLGGKRSAYPQKKGTCALDGRQGKGSFKTLKGKYVIHDFREDTKKEEGKGTVNIGI